MSQDQYLSRGAKICASSPAACRADLFFVRNPNLGVDMNTEELVRIIIEIAVLVARLVAEWQAG